MSNWTTLSSKVVYENKWLSVIEDEVLNPVGEKTTYSTFNIPDEIIYVAAIDDNQRICLVEQFRYPLMSNSWEVIAGRADFQNSEFAARRELTEEAGLKAKNMKLVGSVFVDTGLSPSKTLIYLATGLEKVSEKLDRVDGIIQMKYFTENEIMEMIRVGKLQDPHSITAIVLAYDYIRRNDVI